MTKLLARVHAFSPVFFWTDAVQVAHPTAMENQQRLCRRRSGSDLIVRLLNSIGETRTQTGD